MRSSFYHYSIIGPNGLVPFVLMKHTGRSNVAALQALNSAVKVGAYNRSSELLCYMISRVTGKVSSAHECSMCT